MIKPEIRGLEDGVVLMASLRCPLSARRPDERALVALALYARKV